MGAHAGAIAGVAGCATFLILHAAWIVPIWFVAPVAFGIAAAAGTVLGIVIERLELLGRSVPARAIAAFVVASLMLLSAGSSPSLACGWGRHPAC